MPRISSIKLSPEVKKEIAKAIKDTLIIGDCMEVDVEITGFTYNLKAEGCVQDAE